MKTNLFLSAALALLTLQACQPEKGENAQNDGQQEPPAKKESPVKMIEGLVGEWEQAGPARGAANAQGDAGQTLTFTEEARYIVRQGSQKTDSGAYRMNEQLNNLYLESEANEDAREYEVELQRDTLILSAKEGSQAEEEQIYVRRN